MSETQPITLFIVEDQVIARLGLRLILERIPEFAVVGEAEDGLAAVAGTLELKPAVVLMDIMLPGIDGIEATKQIKAALPGCRVLMLTSYERDDDVFAALSAGADGYCLKTISAEQLALAIRAVADGVAWLDPGIARRVLQGSSRSQAAASPQKPRFALSQREHEVLQLIVDGLSNQEIADRLILSAETIKTHIRHIMEKLAVSDRTQAAVKALRERLL
jgi:two-component system, NarL family, response regulator LiaR